MTRPGDACSRAAVEPLSGLDATFLYLETPAQLLHVGGLFVLDTATMRPGYDFERFRAVLEQRVRQPAFRRRLRPAPLGLGHPMWTVQSDVSIERHVFRHDLAGPAGPRALTDLCAELMSVPLDRSRPLWELHVIEGLGDGQVAVLAKFHHALVDGVTAANLLVHLCDLPALPQPATGDTAPPPGEPALLSRGLRTVLARPWEFGRLLPETVSVVSGWIGDRLRGRGMPLPFTAPRTSFNHAITGRRTVACQRASLAELERVRNAFGCTVNDVVLAMCAGGLRRYLASRAELPDQPLIVIVPVSVHSDGPLPGTNQLTALFTTLPTQLADPVDRLFAVARDGRTAKRHQQGIEVDLLQRWAHLAPTVLTSVGATCYDRLRLADRHPVVYNLVASNVIGPPVPLSLAGARIRQMYPFGPVFHGIGLNITVVSYAGQLNVGLTACPDRTPCLAELADAMIAELHDLSAAARSHHSPSRSGPARR